MVNMTRACEAGRQPIVFRAFHGLGSMLGSVWGSVRLRLTLPQALPYRALRALKVKELCYGLLITSRHSGFSELLTA